MNWTAHTHYWNLETGATIWLTTDAGSKQVPPAGMDLPIVLGDATIIQSVVLGSSPTAIVIELDSGHLRRLTPAGSVPSERNKAFPGTKWIVQRRA